MMPSGLTPPKRTGESEWVSNSDYVPSRGGTLSDPWNSNQQPSSQGQQQQQINYGLLSQKPSGDEHPIDAKHSSPSSPPYLSGYSKLSQMHQKSTGATSVLPPFPDLAKSNLQPHRAPLLPDPDQGQQRSQASPYSSPFVSYMMQDDSVSLSSPFVSYMMQDDAVSLMSDSGVTAPAPAPAPAPPPRNRTLVPAQPQHQQHPQIRLPHLPPSPPSYIHGLEVIRSTPPASPQVGKVVIAQPGTPPSMRFDASTLQFSPSQQPVTINPPRQSGVVRVTETRYTPFPAGSRPPISPPKLPIQRLIQPTNPPSNASPVFATRAVEPTPRVYSASSSPQLTAVLAPSGNNSPYGTLQLPSNRAPSPTPSFRQPSPRGGILKNHGEPSPRRNSFGPFMPIVDPATPRAIASADLVDLQIQDGVLGGSEGPGLQVPPPQPPQQPGAVPGNVERGEKKDLLDRVDEAVACKCCAVS